MDKIEGGTVLPLADFWIGNARNGHTTEQRGRPVSDADLEASNLLGATGWRINNAILEVASAAFTSSHPCIDVDPWAVQAVIPRLTSDEWAALTPQERREHVKAKEKSREDAEGWRSSVQATVALLETAQADRHHPSLWVPYGHCARLRRYPRVSSGPSPQGSALSKALLMFDTGVELGGDGLWWLAVRAGTMAGYDKLPHQERAEWASKHTEDLRACARNPLRVSFWWQDPVTGKRRDDPWGLLATAMEIDRALSLPDPAAFMSHLPVNVDGTCNGLQHLSALGLDGVGAAATNLTRSPTRRDIYEDVAAGVRLRVARDAIAGVPGALPWVDAVSRDTVKRAVMTTPYGVTARGMRDQLINDGEVPDCDDKGVAANYLRDVLWEAIGEVVVAARDIMGWLQDTAASLAKMGSPFSWTTPMGSTILQAYRPWAAARPLTAFGRLTVATEVDRHSLKPRKCALAASPNYVHSFDAAHMAKTLLLGRDRGITHWSCIHDSYGTHAARMGTLNVALRESFVAIYREDWLRRTYEEVLDYAPHVDITPPPTRGDFDIEQVIDSPWFFA